MEKKKKTILLEDLLFNTNKEKVLEIIDEIPKYEEIIYKGRAWEYVVDPKKLYDYMAYYDTLVDAGMIPVTTVYDKITIFHEASSRIVEQGDYHLSNSAKDYEEKYRDNKLIKAVRVYYP